jgi:hypothetical protein
MLSTDIRYVYLNTLDINHIMYLYLNIKSYEKI